MKRYLLFLVSAGLALCFPANAQMALRGRGYTTARDTDGTVYVSLPFMLDGNYDTSVQVNLSGVTPWGQQFSGQINNSRFAPNFSPSIELSFDYSNLTSAAFSLTVTATPEFGCTVTNPYHFTVDFLTVRQVSATGGSAVEGHAGTTLLPFTVNLNQKLTQPLTFHYKTAGGTATAGQDYPAAEGNATIPAGQTSVVVNVPVTGDTAVEEDETVSLELTAFSQLATAGTVTPATIVSDDTPPGAGPAATLVTETPGTGTVLAWFSLQLPAGRTLPYACSVFTSDGTAKAGSDYRALVPTNITFTPGETQKWVSITVTASAEDEPVESFHLNVESLDSHAVLQAPCTIERLGITSSAWQTPVTLRVEFSAGLGQWYAVEKAAAPNGPWNDATGFLPGANALQSPFIYTDTARGFFRVRSVPGPPPGTSAAGS